MCGAGSGWAPPPPPHRPSRGSRPAPCEVSNSPSPQALATLESVIKSSFVHKGNRSHDYVGGHVWSDKQNEEVYEVDASEGVEATLHDLLIQAGGRAGGGEVGGEEGRREGTGQKAEGREGGRREEGGGR